MFNLGYKIETGEKCNPGKVNLSRQTLRKDQRDDLQLGVIHAQKFASQRLGMRESVAG